MCAMRPSPNGFRLPVCIAKVIDILITGSPLCRGWPLKGLSCVMGNYHAQFLGGLGSAMTPGYPVCDTKSRVLTVQAEALCPC